MLKKCHKCAKTLSHDHHALKCGNCEFYIHKKCIKLNDIDVKLLQSNLSTWFCIICVQDLFPFSGINDQELILIYGPMTRFLALTTFLQI